MGACGHLTVVVTEVCSCSFYQEKKGNHGKSLYIYRSEPASDWSNRVAAMAKDELLPAEGKTDATKNIRHPNKKKHLSAKKLEKKKEHDSLRITMFNRKKTEEVLRTGMTLCDLALKAQGFDVKEDEDKSEKYEFDAYKHAKKVQKANLPTRLGLHR